MNITSDFKFDHPSPKNTPGSYEWWYFDAADSSGEWHIVVIFYQGCPFSTRYNRRWAQGDAGAQAALFPAISISLYFKGEPVFYSMSEYRAAESSFAKLSETAVDIRIGANYVKLRRAGNRYDHSVELDELLPSGDHLKGRLRFESETADSLFPLKEKSEKKEHAWNLTQPRADVTADLHLESKKRGGLGINWKGTGYHDHNIGREPMKQEFTDWYWGRFHFPQYTLVYYLMKTGTKLDYRGWLLDADQKTTATLTEGKTETVMSNFFMLTCARTIELEKPGVVRAMIQQSHILDSGPFYYRFRSDALLHNVQDDVLQRGTGITEYIRPSRIHNRLFWPLVHMRYRYTDSPHWVQRSPKLYRWTW